MDEREGRRENIYEPRKVKSTYILERKIITKSIVILILRYVLMYEIVYRTAPMPFPVPINPTHTSITS